MYPSTLTNRLLYSSSLRLLSLYTSTAAGRTVSARGAKSTLSTSAFAFFLEGTKYMSSCAMLSNGQKSNDRMISLFMMSMLLICLCF